MLDTNLVLIAGVFAGQPKENKTATQTAITHVFVKGLEDGRAFYIETTSIDATAKLVYRFARPQRRYVITGQLDGRTEQPNARVRVRLTTLQEAEPRLEDWVTHGQYLYPDHAHAYAMLSGTVIQDSSPLDSPTHPYQTVIDSLHPHGHNQFTLWTPQPFRAGQHLTAHGTIRTTQRDLWIETKFVTHDFNPFQ